MKNYYLFLDESGHHGLKTINQEFPILLLCGCVVEKEYYEKVFTPEVEKLKQKYFNRVDIILHSRDIRKWQNAFKILGDPKLRSEFYNDLDRLISQAEFTVISSAVLKDRLIKQYGPQANNPYDLSLTFVLERTVFLTDRFNCDRVEVVAEARGKNEDAKLHDQYQIIVSNGTEYVKPERFTKRLRDIDFKKKKENVAGTQLCDLVAYPLANYVLYPDRENIAFKVVNPKMYRQFPKDDFLGYGLKIFP
ncbi:MAG: DUF3800 domain-containing protein [Patescibacteria group bacterium]|nr:DUF3800 domain-containing protein [Patescibacteria group bacterium]